jgi:NhaP-type Na+/H+ and K+/H+ antiporter
VPKGLAAAVLASLPLQMGLPHGEIIKNTVFAVVLFSILIASLLVLLAERGWLTGVASGLFSRFKDGKSPGETADEES